MATFEPTFFGNSLENKETRDAILETTKVLQAFMKKGMEGTIQEMTSDNWKDLLQAYINFRFNRHLFEGTRVEQSMTEMCDWFDDYFQKIHDDVTKDD